MLVCWREDGWRADPLGGGVLILWVLGGGWRTDRMGATCILGWLHTDRMVQMYTMSVHIGFDLPCTRILLRLCPP